MEFRPCIDIHNGKVKQIVGGSLKDRGDFASENFVSEQDSRFYADMYRKPIPLSGCPYQIFCPLLFHIPSDEGQSDDIFQPERTVCQKNGQSLPHAA